MLHAVYTPYVLKGLHPALCCDLQLYGSSVLFPNAQQKDFRLKMWGVWAFGK